MFLTNLLCTLSPNSPKCESGSDSEFRLTGNSVGNSSYTNNTKWPIVSTKTGTVQGFPMKTFFGRSIYAFEGIPFAEPPIGNLRFRVSSTAHIQKHKRISQILNLH